jgi:hypothetical protein
LEAADDACKQAAPKTQVLATLKLLQQWLQSHQLLPAYQEAQELQAMLAEGDSKVFKMRDRSGMLQVG